MEKNKQQPKLKSTCNLEENTKLEEIICKPEVPHPYSSYAMAFVPFQCWGEVYDSETGFRRGTLFPQLDKPFIGEEPIPDERKK